MSVLPVELEQYQMELIAIIVTLVAIRRPRVTCVYHVLLGKYQALVKTIAPFVALARMQTLKILHVLIAALDTIHIFQERTVFPALQGLYLQHKVVIAHFVVLVPLQILQILVAKIVHQALFRFQIELCALPVGRVLSPLKK